MKPKIDAEFCENLSKLKKFIGNNVDNNRSIKLKKKQVVCVANAI